MIELSVDAFSASGGALDDLAAGERLLLEGLRGWVRSRLVGCCPLRSAHRIVGWRTSSRTAALFSAWMQAMECAARRPISLHCRCSHEVSPDERRLIMAVGLASFEPEAGEALLEPLSHDPESMMTLARALAGALAIEGFPVPARLEDPALGAVRGGLSLH